MKFSLILKKIRYQFVIAAIAGFSSVAFADGAYFSAAQPVNWTGWYVGPQAGYGWSNMRWIFPFNQYYTIANSQTFSARPSGGLVGGHASYLYQYRSFIIGAEATYNAGPLNVDNRGPLTKNYPNDTFSTKIDDIETLTARFGVTRNQWQAYVKGGFAIAKTRLHAISGNPGAGVVSNKGNAQNGWTAGIGVDYLFDQVTPNLVTGVEYDYVRLDSRYFISSSTGTIIGNPFVVRVPHINLNMLSAHISIKF